MHQTLLVLYEVWNAHTRWIQGQDGRKMCSNVIDTADGELCTCRRNMCFSLNSPISSFYLTLYFLRRRMTWTLLIDPNGTPIFLTPFSTRFGPLSLLSTSNFPPSGLYNGLLVATHYLLWLAPRRCHATISHGPLSCLIYHMCLGILTNLCVCQILTLIATRWLLQIEYWYRAMTVSPCGL